MHYFYLSLAIVLEVVGTLFLKVAYLNRGWWPVLVIVVCYSGAFYLMTLSLERFPIGFVYAVWAGVGVALVALAGALFFGEQVDLAGGIGLGLIVAGVVMLNGFSRMSGQ